MVGCIGEDAYGQMIMDNLKENHINTDYIVTVPDTTTGTAHPSHWLKAITASSLLQVLMQRWINL